MYLLNICTSACIRNLLFFRTSISKEKPNRTSPNVLRRLLLYRTHLMRYVFIIIFSKGSLMATQVAGVPYTLSAKFCEPQKNYLHRHKNDEFSPLDTEPTISVEHYVNHTEAHRCRTYIAGLLFSSAAVARSRFTL